MAAAKVYDGRFSVDHKTPLPETLVLHWLVLVHSQWGSAEVTESTLRGQNSTLILPVAVVKVYVGRLSVDQATPLPDALVLHWLVFAHSQGGSAEVTESTLPSQNRRSDCLWLL